MPCFEKSSKHLGICQPVAGIHGFLNTWALEIFPMWPELNIVLQMNGFHLFCSFCIFYLLPVHPNIRLPFILLLHIQQKSSFLQFNKWQAQSGEQLSEERRLWKTHVTATAGCSTVQEEHQVNWDMTTDKGILEGTRVLKKEKMSVLMRSFQVIGKGHALLS